MNESRPQCQDDRRRTLLRTDGTLNGIDFVEVETRKVDVDGVETDQHELHVYLMGKLPPEDGPPWLHPGNVVVEGDSDAPLVQVRDLEFRRSGDAERDDGIILVLDQEGGPSPYTLRLVDTSEHAVQGLDPRYAQASFRFLPDETSELDCLVQASCHTERPTTPDLDYLAKDYAGFRQLLLDRLAKTLPEWRDRHSPDLLLTLVEVLAYRADHLSYAQDAVATEAYLDTARLRTSVRRHARLVDYQMHEGCNARAWVVLEVSGEPSVGAEQIQFLTLPEGITPGTPVIRPDDLADGGVPRAGHEVFEPLPERSMEEVVERDVVRPRALSRQLLRGESTTLTGVRAVLPDDLRDVLQRTVDEDVDFPHLTGRLSEFLNHLLDDPALAFAGGGAARAAEQYGTTNALRGPALRRHNRLRLQETFAGGLLGPDRYHFTEAHNEIRFHTWHRTQCCLPQGSTSTTFQDRWLDKDRTRRDLSLQIGEVLILEELCSPRTGLEADADPEHRHAVRLTGVTPGVDPLGDIPIVEVEWATADALPFALTLSSIGPSPECALLEDLSIARGNVVLVDHGRTVREPDAVRLADGFRTVVAVPFEAPHDIVPAENVRWCCTWERELDEAPLSARQYAPSLAESPIVHAESLPPHPLSASRTLDQDPRGALPQVQLFSPTDRRRPWADVLRGPVRGDRKVLYERWRPRTDLLRSDADDRHFVIDVDDHGTAHIRFGDGELGARPAPDTRYLAWYRVGGGPSGNVGPEAITTILLRGELRGGQIQRVRNPMAAQGGTNPEPLAEVRLLAPHAFRTVLQRAVTPEDYTALVLRDFPDRVQRAAARIQESQGARPQMLVLVDPLGGTAEDPDLLEAVEQHLRRYQRIGHDLRVQQAEYLYVDLGLAVTVAPHHRAGAVLGALRECFGNGVRPDGDLGFFHPDALTFGQPIAVSAVVAAALHVPGVARVQVTKLEKAPSSRRRRTPRRAGEGPPNVLTAEPWQIVRLDNDPDRPQHGILTITTEAAS